MGYKVIMTAEHHNFDLQCFDTDWHQTDYILLEDGRLLVTVHEGYEINLYGTRISSKDVEFIKEHLDEYISSARKVRACDGDAWEFRSEDNSFLLGYIYGQDLEIIAKILSEASREFEWLLI